MKDLIKKELLKNLGAQFPTADEQTLLFAIEVQLIIMKKNELDTESAGKIKDLFNDFGEKELSGWLMGISDEVVAEANMRLKQ